MSASTWAAMGLGLITLMGWARLAGWARRTPRGPRRFGWRLVILLAAQPLLAALLYLTLFPPPGAGAPSGTLVAATRGAPRLAAIDGTPRIDLPETPPGAGGEPAPDLATALRRHPGATRLRVLGQGLEPRDRDAAAGLAIDFTPPPLAGLTQLQPPGRVAAGGAFKIGGRVEKAGGGAVELLDPAGRVADTQPLSAAGDFVLAAAARDPGPALFAVRVRDRNHAVTETADVPVWVAADPAPRVLLLAGAPGAEVKQLRRWALDAGVDLQASVGAGAGLELGEMRPHLDPAALGKLDLAIVDERSWLTLGAGERAALIAATREGMGLLLRITGPVPAAVREPWSALGLPLGSGDEAAVVSLAPDAAPSPRPDPAVIAADALPPLTRRVVDVPNPGAAPLLQDAASAPLGRWRSVGRGRAGVWAVTDSSGLVTAGFGARYGELWSRLLATLARTAPTPGPTAVMTSTDATPRAGQRVSLCDVADDAEVLGPRQAATRLYVDPAAGPERCAGYWPVEAGWRLVRGASAKDAERQDRPFYLYPSDALPGVRARELRDATLALAGAGHAARGGRAQRGSGAPAWPWPLALLAAAGAVWLFERARRGDVPEPD